jgi:hypothetical protein
MVAPIKFLSGRQQQQKIGVEGSTEEKKVLEVVGRVGIGTTIFEPTVELEVRGDVKFNNDITIDNDTGITGDLDVNGHAELDNLNVSGLSTFNSSVNVDSTLIVSSGSTITGVSTFNDDVDVGTSISLYSSTGIITASEIHTGPDGIGITTDTISGPDYMIIDPRPAGVGVTSGSVRIKGDLYVDGTEFIVNSTTVNIADYRIGIGTTAPDATELDGAGIGIGSDGHQKTFVYDQSNSALKSSENLNVANGKVYQINGTERLSADKLTLGSKIELINSSDDLIVEVDDSEKLRLTGGNLGIGVTNPSARLDVNGSSELDDVNITGITTFSNDQQFIGEYSADLHKNDFVEIKVTIADKTTNHRYYNSGNSQGFLFDGKESPYINLIPGKTYRFNQEDASNTNHQLKFYLEADKTTAYSSGVNLNGTSGNSSAYTELQVTDTTPAVLYYQSGNSGLGTHMGNRVQTLNSFVHLGNNIGIGTETPRQLFDVEGQVRADKLNVINEVGVGTESPVQLFQVGSVSTLGYSTDGKVVTITADGSVGVGTTNPSAKLDVHGNTELDNLNVTGITTVQSLDIGASSTFTASGITTFKDDITVILPADGSSIGIGTTVFTTKSGYEVDIRGNVNVDGSLFVNGTNVQTEVTSDFGDFVSVAVTNFSVNSGGISTFAGDIRVQESDVGIGITADDGVFHPLQVGSAGTDGVNTDKNIVVVTSDYKVGIGITNPTYKLDVDGDVHVTGFTTTAKLTVGIGASEYTLPAYDGSANSFLRSDGNGNVGWFVSSVIRQSQEFYAGAGQTSFEINYTPGLIDVFLNGVKLANSDYVGTSGTDVILNVGAAYTDLVEVVHFDNEIVASTSILDYWKFRNIDGGTIYNDTDRVAIGVSRANFTNSGGEVSTKLNVEGNVRIAGGIYDRTNVGGALSEVPVADGAGGWIWANVPTGGSAVAGGNKKSVQIHNAVGVVGGSQEFVVDYDNNNFVGIGTTVPQQRLDVHGNLIVNNGSIGIGTTNPSEELQVVGVVSATSFFGSGAALTSINASNISTGTIASGLLSGSYDITVTGGISSGTVAVSTVTVSENLDVGAGNTGIFGVADSGDLNVTGITTTGTLYVGAAGTIGITTILDEDNMVSDSDTALATQQSIKKYVADQITAQDLDITDGTTTSAVDLDSQTLTIQGTSNEVDVALSGQSYTVGLKTDVTVQGTLTANAGVANTMTLTNSVTGIGTTTSIITLDSSINKTEYRSIEYTIQATQDSNYHVTKILAFHDGSNVYKTEYGTIYKSEEIASYEVSIGGNFIRLRATAGSATTANYVVNFAANKIFE